MTIFIPTILTVVLLLVLLHFASKDSGYFAGIQQVIFGAVLIPTIWAIYFGIMYFLK